MISIGDKVVCVDGFEQSPEFLMPNGAPVKDAVYVVDGFSIDGEDGTLGLQIIGCPVQHTPSGEWVGWEADSFRKLEDYKAEQELAYYRTQPTKVHA